MPYVKRMKTYALAIIGDGVAGEFALHHLAKHSKTPGEIIHLCAPDFTPPSSWQAGALVGLNAVEKGVSSLGDQLYEGYKMMDSFLQKHRFLSVEKICHTYLSDHQESLVQRFKKPTKKLRNSLYATKEEKYFLRPQHFLAELSTLTQKNLSKKNISYVKKKEFLQEISETSGGLLHLKTHQESYYTDQVILATGAYLKLLKKSLTPPKESYGQEVQGQTLRVNCEQFSPTQSYSYQGYNLIVHQNTIWLGGGNERLGFHYGAKQKDLWARLRFFIQEGFIPVPKSDPVFTNGIRHLGPQRKVENLSFFSGKVLAISGLYKNGFTLGPLMAQKLVEQLKL